MYLERIEIPAFRVLRDVVLEFGDVYSPQIFPLGSENGGGKSTLLQLIFALFHCSTEPTRVPYLRNLLASDFYAGNDDQRLIARLTIRLEESTHTLEFVSLNDRFLKQKLEEPLPLGFETAIAIESCTKDLETLTQLAASRDGDDTFIAEISERTARLENLHKDMKRVTALMEALNYKHITTYSCPTPSVLETRAFICRVAGQSASKTETLLLAASSKVFLLGPSNQQYLFLEMDARKALLGTKPPSPKFRPRLLRAGPKQRPQIEYLAKLEEAESTMTGFYAYDWLSVNPLVQLFASARDEDFEKAITTGSYGDRITALSNEVNGLLHSKKVRPLADLSGVEFVVVTDDGHETRLSPEDLSQGELKRLMIYAWLRANSALDALVLIDEIEASFHPDWQIGIVRDLEEWAPKNQYILATHSYELCQALTPRHVRELEPRLARSTESGDKVAEIGPLNG